MVSEKDISINRHVNYNIFTLKNIVSTISLISQRVLYIFYSVDKLNVCKNASKVKF